MRFLHTGHIGDIIAFLPTMRALGGGDLIIHDHDPSWPPMNGFRYESLKPLLESQSYIDSVTWDEYPTDIHIDNTHFRQCFRPHYLLSDAQAEYNKVKISYDPWIKVDPDPSTEGRTICTRTPRYQNHSFPWRKMVRHLGRRSLFVGTYQEHQDFTRELGVDIEWYPTRDLLDVARAIKGSQRLICEQSCPWWIAAAMQHPAIRSTSMYGGDGTIDYPKAHYVPYGYVDMKWLEE
jgi:hypothetical protein